MRVLSFETQSLEIAGWRSAAQINTPAEEDVGMVSTNHKMILSNGRFSGTKREELTQAFDAFAASPQKNTLVIHFHGGLVSEAVAEDMAERLLPVYRDAGGYPFFVIWQSGLMETLKNNWQEVINENAFGILVEKVLQFVIGKLDQPPGQKGSKIELPTTQEIRKEIKSKEVVNDLPFADRDSETISLDETLTSTEENQFEELLKGDAAFLGAAVELSRSDAPNLNPELEVELDIARSAEEPGEKGLISTATMVTAGVRILTRAVKRLASQRDHGIYTTVIEEVARELKGDLLGGLVWKLMKKDTADSFSGPGKEFGGTALLEEIHRIRQNGHKPRIILIGHSAGSIYICNFLKEAVGKLPKKVQFEVIFLAPGCSFKLLNETLDKASAKIKTFRCFGMKNDFELRDAILPPLYMSSLLYCVSGLLEDSVDLPLVGMERYHTGNPPFVPDQFPEIKQVHQRLAAFLNPWVWSESEAGPGLMSKSHKHGNFDDDVATLKSLEVLIRAV